MWRWRRGNTRGGCVLIPIPCECLLSPILILLLPVLALLWAFVF